MEALLPRGRFLSGGELGGVGFGSSHRVASERSGLCIVLARALAFEPGVRASPASESA